MNPQFACSVFRLKFAGKKTVHIRLGVHFPINFLFHLLWSECLGLHFLINISFICFDQNALAFIFSLLLFHMFWSDSLHRTDEIVMHIETTLAKTRSNIIRPDSETGRINPIDFLSRLRRFAFVTGLQFIWRIV